MNGFQPTAASYRQGAHTFPGEYYTSARILAEETDRIFARRWHCVGRTSSLETSGEYFLAGIAGESIVVLRDDTGDLRAWFNVCRHRGTRLCQAERGRLSETIRCPYHAWTYALDGRLLGAPHMSEIEGFDKADFPLHAAALAVWQGFVFVSVAERPTPFAAEYASAIERLARFDLATLRGRHRATYDVKANWKLVFQNYAECLHCPVVHPELAALLPYQSGANDLTEGAFLGGYMELRQPHESATLSGRRCALPISPDAPPDEQRRAYYYTLMPNLLLSIHPDYVNYYLVKPIAPDRTLVISEWLFRPESEGSGLFNPDDAIGCWDVTNRQDWDIIERSQLGVSSRRYAPGPYSPRESLPAAWDRAYLRLMGHTVER